MSYRLFNLKKPPLFRPSIVRGEQSEPYAQSGQNKEYLSSIGNSSSTASFRYSPDRYLKSTQQLEIDYSFFENHTFFDSAVSKVSIAFDRIINHYPFDGTLREVEDFEDKLTGYERHVFNTVPKNVGFLLFSGTVVGEDPSNGFDANLGTYLTVKDGQGLNYPDFSKNATALPVLDPKTKPFSFEMFLFVPQQSNDNQIIVQKRQSLASNITLALSSSTSIETAGLVFGITTGNSYLYITSSFPKGEFKQISAQFAKTDRPPPDQPTNYLKLLLDGELITTSSAGFSFDLESLTFDNANMFIGSGSAARLNDEIFTPKQTLSGGIDEFRFYHSNRLPSIIKSEMRKNVYATDDLKAYFKFNEPDSIYDLNSVALDSSGNSLHSDIANFSLGLRATGSYTLPLTVENLNRNPILFIDHTPLLNLNTELLNSASYYDEYNPNLITNLIPPHYFLEGSAFDGMLDKGTFNTLADPVTQASLPGSAKIGNSQLLVSFLLIWAKFFDELKLFVDAFGDVVHVDYEREGTVPDVFLHFLADYYDIKLPDFFPNADLAQFESGEDIYENYSKKSAHTLRYIQNELWRRLLTNALSIQKSKGTIESIRSVLHTMGVNVDELMTLREYGGKSNITLGGNRANRTDNFRFLTFTGSLASDAPLFNLLGIDANKPYLLGSYLSASRVEVGNPPISGEFVKKQLYAPHGMSDVPSDGLMTSGSFTFEGVYKFPTLLTGAYPPYQSLARLHVTGSDQPDRTHGVIANLVLFSGSSSDSRLFFYARPGFDISTVDSPLLSLSLSGSQIFDGGLWNVSFGRRRGDLIDLLTSEVPSVSSSYFLRTSKVGERRLNDIYTTSSFFKERASADYAVNAFQSISTSGGGLVTNRSGSFIVIGSQSIEYTDAATRYLNNTTLNDAVRTTNFAGEAGFIRFWSEEINEKEWKEHVRNPTSVGVDDPRYNYNFLLHNTGTFERMRVYTKGKQATINADVSGRIKLFDFSQNSLHFAGSGFEHSKRVMNYNQLRYTTLDPKFDVLGTTDKVRIRSIQDISRIDDFPYAAGAPVFNVQENEEVFDDLRFSLEMSLVKALDEDIISIFSDYDFLEDALGRTNLLFSETYPQLDQVRKNYFENLTGKLDIDKYYRLFKWFNDTFTSTIEGLLPAKTKFMGVNFVIESHILERHKFKYYYNEIYLKALQRNPERGTIYLSQFVGTIKKF